jgi:S-adenosylmethionine:tRNA ribosyltransferase-isomerase
MKPQDFDYELPASQIAQTPPEVRGASRLLALGRSTGGVAHRTFAELPALLRPDDLLVLNDTRVVPARLIGKKSATGGRAELLLVRPLEGSPAVALAGPVDATSWICLGQASKGLQPGVELTFGDGLTAKVLESRGGGEYVVRFTGGSIERAGQTPLPPYIERAPTPDDAERYQTVYARVPGSVAAPTAGLHFTDAMLAKLDRVHLTLDVGPGTFLPVREDDLERHRMHAERYEISPETAKRVTEARRAGRRIVAVGTTSVRTLESAWDGSALRAGQGETSLFIRPGHAFQAVDAMITNFHLPRSTLLMLVCAFAGTERVLAAYREAVGQAYRFYSYGDAMLIG